MSPFTELYLQGLQEGMAKKAVSLSDMANFRPLADSSKALTGTALGAGAGMVAGGIGNALFGSSREDPVTGEKSNGVLARLAKGATGGAVAGGALGFAGADEIQSAGKGFLRKRMGALSSITPDAGLEALRLKDAGRYAVDGPAGVGKGWINDLLK